MRFIDHSGKKFGKLTVISFDAVTKKWLCHCECGGEISTIANSFTRGKTMSCGCLKSAHGHCPRGKHSSEYYSWYSMIARCKYKAHKRYDDYGGRGIKVCERWQKFENFLEDMGLKPSSELTLDRI